MEIIKQEGVIIKTLDYHESSKIIFLFTKNGKKSFLLNGVKKINSDKRALSQIFQKVNISYYSNKSFPKPIDSDIVDTYSIIKEDILKLEKMAQICDITYYFSDEFISSSDVYDLLILCLDKLKNKDKDICFLIFSLNVLSYLGMDLRYDDEINFLIEDFLNYNFDVVLNNELKNKILNFTVKFYKNYFEYDIKSLFI